MALIEKIKSLHSEMTELVLYNDLKKELWEGLIKDLMGVRSSKVEIIYEFLLHIKETTHAQMLSVWTQTNMTPEMWHNYKLFYEKPVLIEQKQMLELKREFKKKWNALHDKLRRREKDESAEHSEQETAGGHDTGRTDQVPQG